MTKQDKGKEVIESYKNDERMMILVYAQWCINHGLDPESLYIETYPDQMRNKALVDMLELTVPKEESEAIPNETVLNILQVFGNDDLAFLVQQKIDELNHRTAKDV